LADLGQPDGACAGKKGQQVGKNPTDRGKLGTKRHIIVDKNGIPLAVVLSGANDHDITVHDEAWGSLIMGRPKGKELEQHACEDKAYDSDKKRLWLKRRGYVVHIPRKGLDTELRPEDKRYPARRWVVERTGSWHNRFRRLKIRYELKPENYLGFVEFANAIICFRSCHV